MKRQQASDFHQDLLDLYDDYAHGRITRRDFVQRASKFAVGGLTAASLLENLSPNYVWAQQVAKQTRSQANCQAVSAPKARANEGAFENSTTA